MNGVTGPFSIDEWFLFSLLCFPSFRRIGRWRSFSLQRLHDWLFEVHICEPGSTNESILLQQQTKIWLFLLGEQVSPKKVEEGIKNHSEGYDCVSNKIMLVSMSVSMLVRIMVGV